jgi:hypothetical protein
MHALKIHMRLKHLTASNKKAPADGQLFEFYPCGDGCDRNGFHALPRIAFDSRVKLRMEEFAWLGSTDTSSAKHTLCKRKTPRGAAPEQKPEPQANANTNQPIHKQHHLNPHDNEFVHYCNISFKLGKDDELPIATCFLILLELRPSGTSIFKSRSILLARSEPVERSLDNGI